MKQKYSVEVPDMGITISTGTIAKQASGSVTIQIGETTLLVNAVAANKLRPDQDFFPLTVDYRENFSAAGRFPGGYFKREAKPSEKEVLTSRLCDRPLRPLFPKGFMNEVQVIGQLLTTDGINEPDILMVNGASAAMLISDIPWHGPVGCVRIADIDGELIVNPNHEQMLDSVLDLIYVGNEKEMMMIEGSAEQYPEDKFIEALAFAQEQVQKIIAAQKELASICGKTKREFPLVVVKDEILTMSKEYVGERLSAAVFQDNKLQRQDDVDALMEETATFIESKMGEADFDKNQVRMAFEVLQEEVYRENILEHGKRCDGRGVADLRQISCMTDILPRVHGSALFQRGETQGIVITTLGTSRDYQDLDGLTGGSKQKSFILHYNFPPYSVGETGRFGNPGRREIGHGALAERSLLPVLPSEDEYPYAIRLVSEIMESNGSTSMASVCGGCLSLMDAGVPIQSPVAGISCGLVSKFDAEGSIEKHVILTDILGAEDHFGDMDFKICGTRAGITGFQLDLKIKGLPFEITKNAIYQNREARFKILDIMGECMANPNEEPKESAPRIKQIRIDPDKVGALIGPGGKNIRRITELSGAQVDIDDKDPGRVLVYAIGKATMDRALAEIEFSIGEIEVGKTYKGIVRSIKDFGAFVECLPGKEGLVHISELADFRVNKTEDVCKLGDEIMVKCIGKDDKGKVRLSRRAAICEAQGIPYEVREQPARPSRPRNDRHDRHDRHDRGDRR
ncbi:MAG: polyribonucleotide nucleotidyltransferase [Opitutales bacterium]